MARLYPTGARGSVRLDHELLEAWRCRIGVDAGEGFEEPGGDVAEHYMVAGIVAVPLLPQCCRALLDPPAPPWLRFLACDRISDVGTPRLRQRVDNVLGAEDSGVDMAAILIHGVHQQRQSLRMNVGIKQALIK